MQELLPTKKSGREKEYTTSKELQSVNKKSPDRLVGAFDIVIKFPVLSPM